MRYSLFYQQLRILYKYLFGNFCHVCQSSKKQMELHHIDSDTSNNSPENLLYCCSDCHKMIHQTNARVNNIFFQLFEKKILEIHNRLSSLSR